MFMCRVVLLEIYICIYNIFPYRCGNIIYIIYQDINDGFLWMIWLWVLKFFLSYFFGLIFSNEYIYIFIMLCYAKSLQSCPTLCDPIDGSLPGSPVPGILQARTLEWVAISFSSAWKWKVKVKSLSHVWLLVVPWTVAYQAPLSMGFSRQEYWSGVPLPSLIFIIYIHIYSYIYGFCYKKKVIFNLKIHSNSLTIESNGINSWFFILKFPWQRNTSDIISLGCD